MAQHYFHVDTNGRKFQVVDSIEWRYRAMTDVVMSFPSIEAFIEFAKKEFVSPADWLHFRLDEVRCIRAYEIP